MDKGGLHWMTALGGVLIVFAIMLCVPLLLLPIFAGSRISGFWLIVVPIAAAGVSLLVYRHYGDKS